MEKQKSNNVMEQVAKLYDKQLLAEAKKKMRQAGVAEHKQDGMKYFYGYDDDALRCIDSDMGVWDLKDDNDFHTVAYACVKVTEEYEHRDIVERVCQHLMDIKPLDEPLCFALLYRLQQAVEDKIVLSGISAKEMARLAFRTEIDLDSVNIGCIWLDIDVGFNTNFEHIDFDVATILNKIVTTENYKVKDSDVVFTYDADNQMLHFWFHGVYNDDSRLVGQENPIFGPLTDVPEMDLLYKPILSSEYVEMGDEDE